MKILEKNTLENSRAYALRILLHNIVSIELAPGTAISENEIASELRLSRTPVREALIELNKNDLIDIIPHKGSYISKINYDIIEEARFVRLAMEIAVIKLACNDLPPEYIIRLNGNIAEQKQAVKNNDLLKLLELDNKFHRMLFYAVGKKWTYNNIVSSQMIHFNRLRFLTLTTLKNDKTIDDHEKILSAIEMHDKPLAEALIINHIARNNLNRNELIALYPDYFE